MQTQRCISHVLFERLHSWLLTKCRTHHKRHTLYQSVLKIDLLIFYLNKSKLSRGYLYIYNTLGFQNTIIWDDISFITKTLLVLTGEYLDILAISCDSFDEYTNQTIGRAKGMKRTLGHPLQGLWVVLELQSDNLLFVCSVKKILHFFTCSIHQPRGLFALSCSIWNLALSEMCGIYEYS